MRPRRAREARLLAGLALGGLALGGSLVASSFAVGTAVSTPQADLADVASRWTTDFTVQGLKTEPTFIEQVHYARRGDQFSLDASIHGQAIGRLTLDLDRDGQVRVLACPATMTCQNQPPNGFLSTVAVLAALRRGQLTGQGEAASYAGRSAVCVPLETIQPDLSAPVVMDPCFDRQTGAVLAHRRRFDRQFGGATLDETSLRLTSGPFGEPINTGNWK
jgi:hypothetical protein